MALDDGVTGGAAVGNLLPMAVVPDTAAARASGAFPAVAWEMLDDARARGRDASLTWCLGWTLALVEDSRKPLTATGAPGKSRAATVTESLALRVPGLLWCAWERVCVSGSAWKAVGGQRRDGAIVVRATSAACARALSGRSGR